MKNNVCCLQNMTDLLKNLPSDDEPNGGGGGKRQRIDGVYMASDVLPGSPEGGGSTEMETVFGGETSKAVEMNRSMFESLGSVSVLGRRRVMEDAITVVPDLDIRGGLSFFGVYDGHGGTRVSKSCRDKLHKLLLEELKASERENRELNWVEVMGACFSKMDDEIVNCMTEEEAEAGSTATVALVAEDVIVVANCGDSRAVMCRGGDTVALSRDHKLDKTDEKERVEASGGRVSDNRLWGGITTSRSIGDKHLKPYVVAEPEVTVTKRTESDEFLIIASDGLWDVMSNDMACAIVTKWLSGRIAGRGSEEYNKACAVAAKLAELAIAKGSKDNISVIVVELNKTS